MSTSKRITSVSLHTASKLVRQLIAIDLVPILHGSPGLGKSAIGHLAAEQENLVLIDERLAQADPTDVKGLPGKGVDGKATFLPFDTFPLDSDPIPEGKEGWLLFLDELPGASPAVQKAAYKLILDRMVGQHKLHPKCRIMAAGNLITDNAFVEEMSEALKSRLAHIEVHVNAKEWLDWAVPHGIAHEITGFINWKKEDRLYTFKADSAEYTYACPRTWEMASDYLTKYGSSHRDNPLMGHALAAILGAGVANEFSTFVRIYESLPDPKEILRNPETSEVPADLSTIWATIGALAVHTEYEDVPNCYKYLRRLSGPFLAYGLRTMIARNPSYLQHPTIIEEWVGKDSKELM